MPKRSISEKNHDVSITYNLKKALLFLNNAQDEDCSAIQSHDDELQVKLNDVCEKGAQSFRIGTYRLIELAQKAMGQAISKSGKKAISHENGSGFYHDPYLLKKPEDWLQMIGHLVVDEGNERQTSFFRFGGQLIRYFHANRYVSDKSNISFIQTGSLNGNLLDELRKEFRIKGAFSDKFEKECEQYEYKLAVIEYFLDKKFADICKEVKELIKKLSKNKNKNPVDNFIKIVDEYFDFIRGVYDRIEFCSSLDKIRFEIKNEIVKCFYFELTDDMANFLHQVYFLSYKDYTYSLLHKRGQPSLIDRKEGFYLYREINSEEIYVLVIHENHPHKILNLTKLKKDKQCEEILERIKWPEDTIDSKADLNNELIKLIILHCDREIKYDLVLMKDFPETGKAEKWKIYLEKNGARLKYVVETPKGKKGEGLLNINISGELTEQCLELHRSDILNETSKKKHTHRVINMGEIKTPETLEIDETMAKNFLNKFVDGNGKIQVKWFETSSDVTKGPSYPMLQTLLIKQKEELTLPSLSTIYCLPKELLEGLEQEKILILSPIINKHYILESLNLYFTEIVRSILRGEIVKNEESFLGNDNHMFSLITASLFLSESARNPVSYLSSLVLLDLIEYNNLSIINGNDIKGNHENLSHFIWRYCLWGCEVIFEVLEESEEDLDPEKLKFDIDHLNQIKIFLSKSSEIWNYIVIQKKCFKFDNSSSEEYDEEELDDELDDEEMLYEEELDDELDDEAMLYEEELDEEFNDKEPLYEEELSEQVSDEKDYLILKKGKIDLKGEIELINTVLQSSKIDESGTRNIEALELSTIKAFEQYFYKDSYGEIIDVRFWGGLHPMAHEKSFLDEFVDQDDHHIPWNIRREAHKESLSITRQKEGDILIRWLYLKFSYNPDCQSQYIKIFQESHNFKQNIEELIVDLFIERINSFEFGLESKSEYPCHSSKSVELPRYDFARSSSSSFTSSLFSSSSSQSASSSSSSSAQPSESSFSGNRHTVFNATQVSAIPQDKKKSEPEILHQGRSRSPSPLGEQ